MAPLDTDIDRPADQSSMASPSSANVNVASGGGAGIMSEAALLGSLDLEDKTRAISSSETKTLQTLAGVIRPMTKEFLSNTGYQQAIQDLKRPTLGGLAGNLASERLSERFGGFSNEQGGSNVENFNTSALPFQQFSGGMLHSANIVPEESLYPIPGMHSDDCWIQSTQTGEMMQLGNTAYYPQFAGYSEVESHYEPESMQMSGYLPDFEPGFESINQRGTGTGQPPVSIKETNFQNPMGRQSFPPSSNRYDSTYH